MDDPPLTTATPTDGDIYEDYPEDEDQDLENPRIALDIAKAVRTVGNKLLSEGKTDLALKKYQSKCSPGENNTQRWPDSSLHQ